MKIKDLIGKKDIPIKVSALVVERIAKGTNNEHGGGKFPSLMMVVTDVQRYHGEVSVSISSTSSNGKTSYVAVPSDFEVTLLKGAAAKKLLDMITNNKIKNLHENLYHPSYQVGCDPEIFVEDDKGMVIPAFDFLGSKKKPDKTMVCGNQGGKPLYWDGFQAEFETNPAACLAYHVDNIHCGLSSLLQKAKAHNKNAKLSSKTVMEIPPQMLESAKEEHVTFGCMPSFNAYDLKGANIPARLLPFRSAGGHIHFGWGEKSADTVNNIVKALDAILGVACVSLFAKFDNPARRQHYGMAGEYRLPKHGMEYRVLSNAWTFHPLIMNLVFDLARKAAYFGEQGLLKFWDATEAETVGIIQNCNVVKARKVIIRNKKIFLALIKSCYADSDPNVVFKIFMNGMESAVKDPTNIEANWKLRENEYWNGHNNNNAAAFVSGEQALKRGEKIA